MAKKTFFTTCTPLPRSVTRETVIETLHNHPEMIQLNPLVIKYELCPPPRHAPADEFHCIWYELTDTVHYLPGGLLSGDVTFNVCFHDLPYGLQTHVYAPAGLDIRGKWSVGGNMPGEPREPVEFGINAPRDGLYLREDVEMRCNVLVTSFVKKTLKKAHGELVDRLVIKTDLLEEKKDRASVMQPGYAGSINHRASTAGSYAGSQMPYSPTGSDHRGSLMASPTPAVRYPVSQQDELNAARQASYPPARPPVHLAELPVTAPAAPSSNSSHRYGSSIDGSSVQGSTRNSNPPDYQSRDEKAEHRQHDHAELEPEPLRPRSGRRSPSRPGERKFELE